MNLSPNNDWSLPQRQARAGLLIIAWKAIITIIKSLWPALVVLLFRQGKKDSDFLITLLIVIPVLILARSLVDFFYFRFYIQQDELIVKKGLISKKTITIPLARIQAVHIEQGLLHQALDVAKVRIDTAGSEKTEATIDALPVGKAEQLKSFLLREQESLTGESMVASQPVEVPVIRLSVSDILKLGISANHIQAFFIVLAFAFSAINNLEEVFGDRVIRTVKDSSSAIAASLVSLALVVAFILCISVVVSMVRIVLNYFDFTLSETTQGFKLRTGLINTRQNLVPFSKIQFISWEANWIRRKIGLYNLEFHLVTGDENEASKKRKVKVPVTQAATIGKLLLHYHTRLDQSAHSTHVIHTVYPFRRTLLVAIIPVAVLLLAAWLTWWKVWMLLLLLWIPYVFINAWFFRRNFRLLIAPDALEVKTGIWGREVKIIKWYKIQQIGLQQSIYQRQHALATMHLHTAGGAVDIPYIPLELANRIRNYALYEVERSAKPWM